ncbi:MAG: hypothetical protein WD960_11935 [Gemmatimonadota bacterium]
MTTQATDSTPRPQDPFAALPDTARLWCFGVSRELEPDEEGRLLDAVDRFLAGWKAHGHPLAASRDWREGRFLLVATDDRITPPSGCSIDALVRGLRELEQDLGMEMVGGGPVWFRQGGGDGGVRRVSRAEFKTAAREGVVGPETIVFDLALTRVGELREGRWERPARNSWHARLMVPGKG